MQAEFSTSLLETLMSKNERDTKIGAAWQAHYDGKQEVAVEQFSQIVAEDPDNIDANWGLGLSYRKMDDKDHALQVFEKVRDLVTVALESDSENYERYLMLQRMVKQQIEQIDDFI
jgi:lipopolysaccharide biosynthesis regulator YciM